MARPRPVSLDRFQPQIEAELKRVVGAQQSPLYSMLRFHLGWTDQMGMPDPHGAPDRVLGTLCLLSAEAVGGTATVALPAAAAVELALAFTTVHQHIADGSPGGQGRSAVWWAWGHSQGINAGDGMYALAREAVLTLDARGASPETAVQAAALLDRACLEACEQRSIAIENAAQRPSTPDQHLKTLEGTVGALYGCAASLGALVGGAVGATVQGLGRFGRELGVAAHVRREIDVIWEPLEGRSGLMEALDHGRSLPLLLALRAASGSAKQRLEAAVRRETVLTDDELDALVEVMAGLGARRDAAGEVQRRVQAAAGALGGARLAPRGAEQLLEFARYLTGATGEAR